MRHVVMWSSGITSWAVAKLVIQDHGQENTTLLFADVLAEDEDNYRFNRDAATQLGMELTVVCDGRDPQQVNRDTRWLSNSRAAKCSELLKIKPSREWLEANCDPAETVLYLGLDWTEPERVADGHPWVYLRAGAHTLLCPDHQAAGHRQQRFEWEPGDTTIRTSCECGAHSGDLEPTTGERCTQWWREHIEELEATRG